MSTIVVLSKLQVSFVFRTARKLTFFIPFSCIGVWFGTAIALWVAESLHSSASGAEYYVLLLFTIVVPIFVGIILVSSCCGSCCASCYPAQLICCRSCKQATDDQPEKEDSEKFITAFGWALESYKKEIEGFEIWGVISRTLIIAGSTIMYPENRFVTHMVVMVWSLFLHARFCPYMDQESNVCAILFCICDILGAITAFQTYESAPSTILQIIFIVVTFMTMVVVGVAMTRGMHAQAVASQTGLLGKSTNDLFALYTPLEKKLLFPVLAIVWLVIKCLQKIDKQKGNTSNDTKGESTKNGVGQKTKGHNTKITPLSENQEDSSTTSTTSNSNTAVKPQNIRRESSFVARSTVEHAEIAANLQKQQLQEKQNIANKRLEDRLAKRNGTYVEPVHVLQIPDNNNSSGVKITDNETTIKARAIQQQSERSRKNSIQLIQEREKIADARVQQRLALRLKAKQSHVLQNCAPFANLSKEAQDAIVDTMTYEKIEAGTQLCKQGDIAKTMYLLMSGKCTVTVRKGKGEGKEDGPHNVGNLKKLDVFGEAALFGADDDPDDPSGRRTATVTATKELKVLILSKKSLNELMESGDLDANCIQALKEVANQRQKQNEKEIKKKEKQIKKRAKQTRALAKCKPFAELNENAHDQIVDVMLYKKMKKGTVICQEGDEADEMFLLMSGTCKVTADDVFVGTLTKSDVFGESAMGGGGQRSATVIADTDLKVLVLKRDDVQRLVKNGVLSAECLAALEKIAMMRQQQKR